MYQVACAHADFFHCFPLALFLAAFATDGLAQEKLPVAVEHAYPKSWRAPASVEATSQEPHLEVMCMYAHAACMWANFF